MESQESNEEPTDRSRRPRRRCNVAESGVTSVKYDMFIVGEGGRKADRFLSQEVTPADGKKVTDNEPKQEDSGRDQEKAVRTEESADREGRKTSYTPDHDILTKGGWKPIGKVSTADEVATLDRETDEIQYKAPTDTQQFRYEGKLYRVESQQIDLKVTSDHRMYVNPRNPRVNGEEYAGHRLMQADSIAGKRVRYKTNGKWTGTSSETTYLDALDVGIGKGSNNQVLSGYATKTELPTNDLFELTGLFVAEGFTHADDSGNYTIQISQCPEKHPNIYDRIAELLGGCGASARECTDRVIGTNKQLYNFLDKIPSGAGNKRVPRWMLSYDTPHLEALLDGLIAGDGHETKTGYGVYTSISRGLCGDVQEIALKTGQAARVFQSREAGPGKFRDRDISCSDCYKTHIRPKRLTPTINHSHTQEQNAQTEEFIDYSGEICSCTVPNGVIYVRRNGKPCWCGGSSGAV